MKIKICLSVTTPAKKAEPFAMSLAMDNTFRTNSQLTCKLAYLFSSVLLKTTLFPAWIKLVNSILW